MMYAVDILIDETRKGVNVKLKRRRELESCGFKINRIDRVQKNVTLAQMR